jgi:hypothetical protein
MECGKDHGKNVLRLSGRLCALESAQSSLIRRIEECGFLKLMRL